MPKSSPIQYAFNGGQLGLRLGGRADLARYSTGCNTLRNFIPTYQGPALKRSGTRHVKEVKDSIQATRLVPFVFSSAEAYVLELGAGYLRFMRNSGAVLEPTQSISGSPTAANPVQVTVTAHGYANGDEIFVTNSGMAEINGRYFEVSNVTLNTFDLLGEDGSGRSTGAGGEVARTYEIRDAVSSNSIPWAASELFDIKFVQSADVLYMAHPNHPPHKLSRMSDTSWICEEIVFNDPPFAEENDDESVTIYVSAQTGGAVTATASSAVFTADHVGSYIRLREEFAERHPKWGAARTLGNWNVGNIAVGDLCYNDGNVYELTATNGSANSGFDPPIHESGTRQDKKWDWEFQNHGYGYGKITAVGSPTSATVDVDTDGVKFPASTVGVSNATDLWAFSAFNEVNGYPRAVAFFEDRLWWAGTNQDPQTFWGSETGEYENYRDVDARDDTGVSFTLQSDKVNAIQWMSGEDTLLIGTLGGEFTADGGSDQEAITPSNIRARRRSNFGTSANVSPVFVDSATLMVDRSGRRIHQLQYSFQSDRYVAPELTQFAYDILSPGVVEMAYQPSPFRMLWAVLADGTLSSLTYVPDEEVLGWATHSVGGADALVESVTVIPHPDGDQDQAWIIVRRTINGQSVRYIEFFEKHFEEGSAIADAFFVDSGLSYDGAPIATLLGLNYLEGEAVSVLADGAILPPIVVSNGQIPLLGSFSKIHAGLAMPEARLETMRFESGAADGAAQGRRKRIHQLVIRLLETGTGLFYGPDFDTMDALERNDLINPDPSPAPLFTGDTASYTMPGGYNREGRVAIAHRQATPCTVVALMPQMTTESR